jgi:hypothetical protein
VRLLSRFCVIHAHVVAGQAERAVEHLGHLRQNSGHLLCHF